MTGKRIRDYGFSIGKLPTGPLNKITDVAGVLVGHCTIKDTGVTVILPHQGNIFVEKVPAACHIHNGFGKTAGLMQIEELGTIETPIALTSTMNVGLVFDALIGYTLDKNPEARTVNAIVGECNDSCINARTDRPIKSNHVLEAISAACTDFDEGNVGAGTGTVCFGLKGGIGSSSRQIIIDGETYTFGVLVQSNFGETEYLTIDGRKVGGEILAKTDIIPTTLDRGSIMMIAATDLPVSSRQLKRIIRRCSIGLSKAGSYMGHGSGDIMIGFSTANRNDVSTNAAFQEKKILREDFLELAFVAAADATQEAIYNSMTSSSQTLGVDGRVYKSLSDLL